MDGTWLMNMKIILVRAGTQKQGPCLTWCWQSISHLFFFALLWISMWKLIYSVMFLYQSNIASVCWTIITVKLGHLLTKWITVEQSSSWEAYRSALKFPAFCGTQRLITAFTTAGHQSLSWTRSVYAASHCLKIHFDIILPSALRSSKWSLSLMFSHQNPVHTSPLPHTCYLPRPSHSSWFDQLNIWWGVQIIELLVIMSIIVLGTWMICIHWNYGVTIQLRGSYLRHMAHHLHQENHIPV
jgi:hypothetical protein